MSIFKSIGKVAKGALSVIAPTIAGALPGPLGSIARAAVTEALGLDKESSDEQIEKALATTNPEILERIRKAEQDFIAQMKRLEIDMEKVFADDRASARQMYVAARSHTTDVLSYVVVAGWVGMMGIVAFRQLPQENRALFDHSLGILDMALGLVLGFWFGTSFGSRKKTDALMENGK